MPQQGIRYNYTQFSIYIWKGAVKQQFFIELLFLMYIPSEQHVDCYIMFIHREKRLINIKRGDNH